MVPAGQAVAPLPPQNLDAEERAWAAGLFEGEGSIALRRNRTVLLSLGMTDRDVVERFRAVLGTGQISSQPPGRNRRTKTLWRVDVGDVAEVMRIIDLFYPYLGARRRARADEVLEVLRARIEAATQERACPNCGLRFRPPFTPNAKVTKYCSRLCERRYHWRLRWERARARTGQIGLDI
jgi:LAGLIDADG-like domain